MSGRLWNIGILLTDRTIMPYWSLIFPLSSLFYRMWRHFSLDDLDTQKVPGVAECSPPPLVRADPRTYGLRPRLWFLVVVEKKMCLGSSWRILKFLRMTFLIARFCEWKVSFNATVLNCTNTSPFHWNIVTRQGNKQTNLSSANINPLFCLFETNFAFSSDESVLSSPSSKD